MPHNRPPLPFGWATPVTAFSARIDTVTMRGIKIGGLMRCCIQSIRVYEKQNDGSAEGTIAVCQYCEHSAIVGDGQWQWNTEITL